MCIAIPGKILEIKGDEAKVEFGGVRRNVNISLVDVRVGDYVLVHVGFAIQKVDEVEAKKARKLLADLK